MMSVTYFHITFQKQESYVIGAKQVKFLELPEGSYTSYISMCMGYSVKFCPISLIRLIKQECKNRNRKNSIVRFS